MKNSDDVLEKVLEIFRTFVLSPSDDVFQSIVNQLFIRTDIYNHMVKAFRFNNASQIKNSPAFTIGVNFNKYPIGAVCISDKLSKQLTDDEIQFVIAHEVSHILKSHLVSRVFTNIIEDIIKEIFSEDAINTIKVLLHYLSDRKTILTEQIVRENELEADSFAIQLTGNKEAAILALEKLTKLFANGNFSTPSHYTVIKGLPISIVTFEERIKQIRKL